MLCKLENSPPLIKPKKTKFYIIHKLTISFSLKREEIRLNTKIATHIKQSVSFPLNDLLYILLIYSPGNVTKYFQICRIAARLVATSAEKSAALEDILSMTAHSIPPNRYPQYPHATKR